MLVLRRDDEPSRRPSCNASDKTVLGKTVKGHFDGGALWFAPS